MEIIKVNMTPCEDVQTIHASQNDGEARQWEFELHNNGELIDTSDVKEQLVFKAYKGGTEQLLPENGSTPTTSPFLGDIKYPQGLLSDQEFTYRQSPTEEDGLAKITDIKGNTINWNQQHHEQSSTYWSSSNASSSYADGIGTFTASSDGTFGQNLKSAYRYSVVSHKYLFICTVKSSSGGDFNFGLRNTFVTETLLANTEKTVMSIQTATTANDNIIFYRGNATSGDKLTIKNSMCFDLTQMGLDITDSSEFTSLFSLPYYAYNQGSLLSFNGNGIKTVGKNQSQLVSMTTASGGYINASSGDIANVKKGITYTLSFDNLTASTSNVVARILVDGAWKQQGYKNLVANSRWTLTFTATDDGALGLSAGLGSQYSEVKVFDNIQLEIGSTATSFEPYTESTLSLPISTYFPTGMKSAGNVYDELTESKAITRIGQITINGSYNVYLSELTNCVRISLDHGRTDVKYPNPVQASNYLPFLVNFSQDSEHFYMNGASAIIFILKSKCGTTAESVKAYLNSNPLTIHYELATPTETSFTTASLVTENAEIPLSNDDGVLLGKCTEQLSENPGFIDAKIKLSDSDGECYSNKIQLHIERSPQ